MSNNLNQPVLKWAGGKRWLVPILENLFQDKTRRLVEPFCGGLAVSLGLQPQNALLNDINLHLICFYRQVQNGLKSNIPMRNEKTLFYQYRDKFNLNIQNGITDTKEMALLFYYLNKTCFNGLCRFNRKGLFNTPFGKYKKINYYKDFSDLQKIIQHWTFTNLDFEKLEILSDDFIYLDPPYDTPFTSYSKQDFEWEDQVRLIEWITAQSASFIISNQATDRIITLYKKAGLHTKILDAPRKISANGNRKSAKEVLASRIKQ